MLNRDVISPAYIAAFLSLIIISPAPHATGKDNTALNNTDHYSTNQKNESYENYLPHRTTGINASNQSNKRKSARNQNRNRSFPKKTGTRSQKNPKFMRYSVRRGDTLTSLSKKFNIPVSAIQSYNKIKNQNMLKKGMLLKIPVTGKSTVPASKNRDKSSPPVKSNNKPLFSWPVPHVVDYMHDGVNGVKPIGIIITSPAGSTVLSSASGTVKKIGRMRGFGKYIVIDHPGRYATVYSNLREITVSEGEKISTGIVIGRIDASDRKLHFQINFEGKPDNPLKYLPKNI